VRDTSIPDPSLAKVVKDSTITILSVSDQFVAMICGNKGAVWGGFVELGRTA
jgi:hypothetical protein